MSKVISTANTSTSAAVTTEELTAAIAATATANSFGALIRGVAQGSFVSPPVLQVRQALVAE